MAVREGKWRCPSCNQANRGRDMNCQGCGSVRGTVKFFLDDDAPELTDGSLLQHAGNGPDWVCGYCGTSNSHSSTACKQCSGDRTLGESRRVEEKSSAGEGMSGAGSPDAASPDVTADGNKGRKPGKGWCGGIGCCGMLLVFFLLLLVTSAYDSFYSESEEVEVHSREWRRTVEIEQRRQKPWEGWQGSMPQGLVITASETRRSGSTKTVIGYDTVEKTYQEKVKKGTKLISETVSRRVKVGSHQVKTGVRDLGNGFFEDVYKSVPEYDTENVTVQKEVPVYDYITKKRPAQVPRYREDPVYDTWVTGFSYFWEKAVPLAASGAFEEPIWPDISSGPGNPNDSSPLRPCGRNESYTAAVRGIQSQRIFDVSKIDTLPLSFDLFQQMKLGRHFQITLGGLGDVKSLIPISP